MIMINENWEQAKDLSDVLRIVSENIGNEFSQKVEEICGEPSEELYAAYQKLENEKNELEQRYNDYGDISESLDYLNEQIDKLEKYIDDNLDGTDFMEGMRKAFEMIER
ncbi:hypothetical protein [Roseburia sp. 1XD42-69]|uniref:hypothetical protein n=1 Tax=Roseburia sp. 1XD42-69 TaxID=2320088 RepID=UPI000EA3F189|nr:hypothetical protein [Roseburia sp. 1XD42-69]RKJ68721.1 hypothetical protein D7Y06_00260 [Roseburia sp. 1XD42-69]